MNLINRNNCAAFTTKDSSTIVEIMAPRNSKVERQSLAEATVYPMQRTIAHSHPCTEEIYFILGGSGLMAIESEIQSVRVGDAVGILAGQRHQILNTGSEPLVFLCCCVPAYSDGDTIECESLLA